MDPISRQDLHQEQLIPNRALKEAIDTWKKKNGLIVNYNLCLRNENKFR